MPMTVTVRKLQPAGVNSRVPSVNKVLSHLNRINTKAAYMQATLCTVPNYARVTLEVCADSE